MITGLAGGRYLLKIDDHQIGTFFDSQLGAGINLALLMSPLQSLDILEEELIQRQREAAQPKPHYYDVTPVN